jgi:putative nucleotidyltransferase with HDIG domain
VRDLLLSACFINVFPAKHKNFDYPKFWQHSLAVADCARQLSAQLCLCEDLAFTAGLLHDIGKLVIVLLFPEEYKRCLLEPQPLSIADEQRAMGFDHVSIGSKVAQVWNLPVNIQEAIEQHETLPTHTGSTKSLGTVIYTANLLIHHIDQLQTVETSQQEALAYVLNFLDIPYEEANAWAVSSQKFATQILAAL